MSVFNDLGEMPTEKPRIVVYVDEEIKAAVEKLASKDDRPVSNYVLQLIKQDIEAAKTDGRLKADEARST